MHLLLFLQPLHGANVFIMQLGRVFTVQDADHHLQPLEGLRVDLTVSNYHCLTGSMWKAELKNTRNNCAFTVSCLKVNTTHWLHSDHSLRDSLHESLCNVIEHA